MINDCKIFCFSVRRSIALILAILCFFTFSACSNKKSNAKKNADSLQTSQETSSNVENTVKKMNDTFAKYKSKDNIYFQTTLVINVKGDNQTMKKGVITINSWLMNKKAKVDMHMDMSAFSNGTDGNGISDITTYIDMNKGEAVYILDKSKKEGVRKKITQDSSFDDTNPFKHFDKYGADLLKNMKYVGNAVVNDVQSDAFEGIINNFVQNDVTIKDAKITLYTDSASGYPVGFVVGNLATSNTSFECSYDAIQFDNVKEADVSMPIDIAVKDAANNVSNPSSQSGIGNNNVLPSSGNSSAGLLPGGQLGGGTNNVNNGAAVQGGIGR